jgi:hypothetical protein
MDSTDRLRSGLLVVWANAWLAGRASYDDVIARVTGDDEPHRVGGLSDSDDVPLGWVLTELRSREVSTLRLVLPVAGDPRGLPASTDFAAAALDAGEAVLGSGLGLVPTVTLHGAPQGSKAITVHWQAYEVRDARPDPLSVAEAEQELTGTLRDVASDLARLDVASWRPEIAEAVASIRETPRMQLPSGHDPRAARLLAQADRLAAVLRLADADAPGGSVTGGEARQRADLLRPLATAIRRARLAAYNAEPANRYS